MNGGSVSTRAVLLLNDVQSHRDQETSQVRSKECVTEKGEYIQYVNELFLHFRLSGEVSESVF